ncbi:TonB-dependent receptor [Altererythrobacter sp. GH1-8]|uniref:TonB-dependent receptor n=1 Tax=Altererythrobacter sp. GH1-8 TaxID=3349333 RepID=UPI00374D0BA8
MGKITACRSRLNGAVALAAIAIMSGTPALAQDEAEDNEESYTGNQIIVTASGREQTLQDTPISISAFSEEQIDRYAIENFEDLAKRTPGLNWSSVSTLTDTNPSIRGVGTARAAGIPSVGVFIDGIDIGNGTFGNVPTFDLQRVEVVRGPQSALFGRGVLAGAVNYITRRPSFTEASGMVQASIAEGGEYVFQGRVETPISDVFAVSVAGRYTDLDGFFENTASGKTIGGRESYLIDGSARLQFGGEGQGEAYLRLSYTDEVQEQADWHQVPSNSTSPRWFIGEVEFDPSLVANNGDDYAGIDRQFFRASLHLDYEFGFATLTSRTSLADYDFLIDQDFDFTAQPDLPLGASLFGNFRFLDTQDISDFSQEVRLTGDTGSGFKWILGGYYRTEDTDEENFSFTGASGSATPDPVNPNLLGRDLETIAIFGSLTAELSDAFAITGELRWAQDSVTEVSQPRTAATAQEFSAKFDNILPRVIAELRPSDDVLVYASAAKGNKPGGFNNSPGAGFAPVPLELRAFDEEIAWNYELGAKLQLLDNRVTLNGAVFYIDWTDIQVNSQIVIDGRSVGYTANANSADSLGFEVEFSAEPSDSLTVYGGLSYSPIRIKDYVDRRVATAGITTDGSDQLGNTPDWTGNIGVEFRQPISDDWDFFWQTDASYNSTMYASVANLAETGDKTIVDMYVGFGSEAIEFTIFANNLFDNKTPSNVAPFVNPTTFARTFIVQAPRPQQFGARVKFSF